MALALPKCAAKRKRYKCTITSIVFYNHTVHCHAKITARHTCDTTRPDKGHAVLGSRIAILHRPHTKRILAGQSPERVTGADDCTVCT